MTVPPSPRADMARFLVRVSGSVDTVSPEEIEDPLAQLPPELAGLVR